MFIVKDGYSVLYDMFINKHCVSLDIRLEIAALFLVFSGADAEDPVYLVVEYLDPRGRKRRTQK